MHFRHTEPPSARRNDWHSLRSLFPFLWKYRGRVGFALSALVLAKVANVGIPLALKEIVDRLSPDRELLALPLGFLLAYGALRLANNLFQELRDTLFARVRHGAERDLSLKVLEHLHRLSLRFHLERKTGGITRDIERGTRSVSSLLNYLAFSILPTAAEFVLVAVVLLGHYNIWFTVVSFTAVAIYVVFTFHVTRWRMPIRQRMNRVDSEAGTMAIDSLLNYETVKYFGAERLELERYSRSTSEWLEAAVRSQSSMSLLNFGQGAIIAVAVTIIMVLASRGVVSGELTVGDLVLVNAFLLQLFIPLGFLGIVYSQLQHALTDMEQMFSLLREPAEIRDEQDASDLVVTRGEVRFEAVDFSYDANRQVLHAVDFTVAPRTKVAVVGPSGAGKSSLARLLFRFYDVTAGSVQIDGQDIRRVSQESLRRAIGIVPQDTVLFNDTIFYNILYARPEANEEEVHHAARLANIHDFIVSLPEGYGTVVGERGLKLSGGEKQRVAIARVILKDPAILLFDEATSSLDSRAERSIQAAIAEMAEAKTTLVIAHRLSTVVDSDQILVLDGGRIVERGTHRELLQLDGLYAQMWALQQERDDDTGMER